MAQALSHAASGCKQKSVDLLTNHIHQQIGKIKGDQMQKHIEYAMIEQQRADMA